MSCAKEAVEAVENCVYVKVDEDQDELMSHPSTTVILRRLEESGVMITEEVRAIALEALAETAGDAPAATDL